MRMRTPFIITNADRSRLGSLLETRVSYDSNGATWRDELEVLLEEAPCVEMTAASDGLVTMNSTVRLVDADTGETRTVTLTYPDDRVFVPDAISVLAPLGVALIGRSEGDVVECLDEECRRRWRIAEIVYQPEREGEWRR